MVLKKSSDEKFEKLSITIDPKIVTFLKNHSKRSRRSVSEVVTIALKDWISAGGDIKDLGDTDYTNLTKIVNELKAEIDEIKSMTSHISPVSRSDKIVLADRIIAYRDSHIDAIMKWGLDNGGHRSKRDCLYHMTDKIIDTYEVQHLRDDRPVSRDKYNKMCAKMDELEQI